jgi:hypothetical protein
MVFLGKEFRLAPTSIEASITRRILRLTRGLPRSDALDKLSAFLRFRASHGRNPDPGAMLFNDYLYRLKTTGKLN